MTPPRPEPVTIGMLLDLTDRHVHAVRNPADPYPKAECGLTICPDIYLDQPGGATLHRPCMDTITDATRLRPAVREWRLANESDDHGLLVTFWRRWLTWRYERIISRSLAAERRRRAVAAKRGAP
ncbi:hypothetical protein [Pseudonocardia acaciae]|uniref:hypothetical protein n=1 Tax=Pseudonocardia acaciae TaxID=551276 RepID=UPI000AF3E15A|nr:hypothetical protein [Pseudonocardia acaciae]